MLEFLNVGLRVFLRLLRGIMVLRYYMLYLLFLLVILISLSKEYENNLGWLK